MGSRLRGIGLPLAVAAGCLAVAAPASAADSISGSVANGGCVTARTVTVTAASRIEVTTATTAQNNATILAEIVHPDGKITAGGSFASYDTPGGGSYQIRVCATYQEQSPPTLQYTGVVGTGPAGQPVLTQPTQPQPPTGGVAGASATIAYSVSGKVAIRTGAGLAWFTIRTTKYGSQTLRIVNPKFGRTRVVTGLHSTVTGSTVRVLGDNGLSLTLGHNRLAFTSNGLKASGKIVRGTYKFTL